MANKRPLQQQNKAKLYQKRHLFPISFVSLNNTNSYTSHWPEKWGDLIFPALITTFGLKEGIHPPALFREQSFYS